MPFLFYLLGISLHQGRYPYRHWSIPKRHSFMGGYCLRYSPEDLIFSESLIPFPSLPPQQKNKTRKISCLAWIILGQVLSYALPVLGEKKVWTLRQLFNFLFFYPILSLWHFLTLHLQKAGLLVRVSSS